MKRFLSLILVLLLALSLVACGGDKPAEGGAAQGGSSAGGGDSSSGGGTAIAKSKTAAFVEKYMADGSYTIEYEIPDLENPVLCAFNGTDFYIDTTNEGERSIVLSNGDGLFILMPAYNMYMALNSADDTQTAGLSEVPSFDDTINDDTTFTTGTVEIDGKRYDYEEFGEGDSLCRYCFDGKELVYILTGVGTAEEAAMQILSISADADASLFAIPDGYTAFSMGA